jgi:hypothetical protein
MLVTLPPGVSAVHKEKPMSFHKQPSVVISATGGVSVSFPTSSGGPPIQIDPAGSGLSVSVPSPGGRPPIQLDPGQAGSRLPSEVKIQSTPGAQ